MEMIRLKKNHARKQPIATVQRYLDNTVKQVKKLVGRISRIPNSVSPVCNWFKMARRIRLKNHLQLLLECKDCSIINHCLQMKRTKLHSMLTTKLMTKIFVKLSICLHTSSRRRTWLSTSSLTLTCHELLYEGFDNFSQFCHSMLKL